MGWGVADQALSSLTNFALGLVVARSVSADAFGAFSVALATYLLALGASRGLGSEPFVVRYSAAREDERLRGSSWATGVALLVGILLGTASCLAGLLTSGPTGSALVALGITLPGLLLQDAWRYCYVAAGRSRDAFLNDLAWVLLMVPLFAMELSFGSGSGSRLLFLWGLSGTAAGVIAVARERLLPRPGRTLSWLCEQRDLAPRYLGEFAAASGSLQLTMYVVAIVAGLAAAGSLRAGFILLGPVGVIFQGIRLVAVPEAVRLLRRSASELHRMTAVLAAALATTALVWGGVILLLPFSTGRTLLGSSWLGAHDLIVPLILMLALSGAELAAVVALRALAAAKSSFRARVVEGGLTLAGGTIGAVIGGARGAAWALVIAYALEVMVWWWQLSLVLRRRSTQASGAGSSS
jgi:hypothetical protein